MVYFINYVLVQNTAPTNRILSYLNGIPQDMNVNAIFFFSEPHAQEEVKCGENVKIKILYDFGFKSNFLKKLICFFKSILYIRGLLKNGDVVYTYNVSLLKYLYKNGVKYYGEMTENPEIVVPKYSRFLKTSLDGHIKLINKLNGLFVISTQLKNYYINKGINEDRIFIINMIVDCERFAEVEKKQTEHKYIAYCGSNYSNEKDGVYKLINSFSIVCRSNPDIYLYIIGQPCDDSVKEKITLMCHELGINNRIVMTGIVKSSQIPQLLKNAEVLLLNRPKNIQNDNGFPTKLGEYLLTKNPVVVTNVGDISSFLIDGENALIASPNSDEEFANKICYLLNHKEYANKIGNAGYLTAISHFNSVIETRKLLKYMLRN